MKIRAQARHWPLHPSLIAIGCLAAVSLTACEDDIGPQPPNFDTTNYQLRPANDCEDVKEVIIDALTEEILEYRYSYAGWVVAETADFDGADAPESGGTRDEAPSDYTETNVQEAGVDEPDIVKTDGQFIYALHQNSLLILKSWPPEDTDIVGQLDLSADNSTYPRDMFLHEDRVAVFSSVYSYAQDRRFSGTRISIIDVSDRTEPVVMQNRDIEGHHVSARMIGSRVYQVTNSSLNIPWEVWELAYEDIPGVPDADWRRTEEEAEHDRNVARPIIKERVAEMLEDVDMMDILPQTRVFGAQGNVESEAPMYACSNLYLPSQPPQLGILNISHFDLATSSNIRSRGLLARGWLVYASQDNLYVAMTSQWWWWWGGQENKSDIHKFRLSAGGTPPEYRASGRVDGWILNQFSMSEHDGYLRVATTDSRSQWNSDTQEQEWLGGNNVIILENDGGTLEEVGSVRGLAPDERIYSARFMGDKGYMVTFRETDPLYTFDLSDPQNPEMLGELKIEGFSSYMHPLGDAHLLAIGRDGDETGRMTGVHLQIFDVSDMEEPIRTHHHVVSTGSWSSYSEAMWNHHAFTYHPGHGILAIPMTIYDDDEHFSGLIIYSATASEGFSEIGRVSHADLRALQECDSMDCDSVSSWNWWTNMRRSIFMSGHDDDHYVYSLSSSGMKVNDLLLPEIEHAAVVFP